MRLKFVGAGFLPGVPARDLGEDEVEQYGGAAALIASGLYEELEQPVEPTKVEDVRPQDGKKDSSK
jgi:hypothetical protein